MLGEAHILHTLLNMTLFESGNISNCVSAAAHCAHEASLH